MPADFKVEGSDTGTMLVKVNCSPAYSLAYCYLHADESVMIEAGALAAMSAGVQARGSIGPGGVGKAVMRKAFGGEGFFMARYTADVENAWVAIAPRFPGDIGVEHIDTDHGMVIEQGALLAVGEGLDVDVRWAGVRNIVMKVGATLLHITGDGDLVLASYGGLQRFEVSPGESIVVDTGHIVGFSDNMKPKVGMMGSATTAITGGEGLVGLFEGPGVVLVQTRAEQELRNWLFPEKAQNRRGR